MGESNRLYEIDIAKAITIILVVIGHAVYYQIVTPYGGINYDILIHNAGLGISFVHEKNDENIPIML